MMQLMSDARRLCDFWIAYVKKLMDEGEIPPQIGKVTIAVDEIESTMTIVLLMRDKEDDDE